jgi:two-component system response regulator FixJ
MNAFAPSRLSPDTSIGVTVIVDDDHAASNSLSELLAGAGSRVLTYSSAEELLAAGVPREADCLVVDARLGQNMDGISLVEHLRRTGNRTPVVMVTGHGDVRLAMRAIRAGAAEFLEKPCDTRHLLEAIEGAARRCAEERRAAALLSSLSPREREVLVGLVSGKSNKEVANDLSISVRTAEAHRATIMTKLQVSSLAHLVRLSLTAGLPI